MKLTDVERGFAKNHPFYPAWLNMKARCYSKNSSSYRNYGARGIKVVERWLERRQGFWNFVEDMGERPEGYSLDRIDNNGNYKPDNCRWASWSTQMRNRRHRLPKTGFHNVVKNGKKWRPYLYLDGKQRYFGGYSTVEEAASAAVKIKAKYYGNT